MSNSGLSTEPANARGIRDRVEAILVALTSEQGARAIAVALFFLGCAVMLMYKPFSQLEVGDSAGYDYIAQSILRGQVPYRDVVDMKAPGSMYLSAFAMILGKLVGVRDVVSVRLFQSLLVGLLCVITFHVARAYLGNTLAAMIAAACPLTSYKFAEWMVVGTQPKLPMIIFGMLSMLFIARDRPFLAGLTSMLSFLCWQPGLMFTGVSVLIFSRYLTSWRDRRAVKVLFGAVLPLAIVSGYFYALGALDDLWAWTMVFNYSVFRPETQREPLRALNHIWSVMKRVFGPDAFAALLGVVGFVMFGFERVRDRIRGRDRGELFKDALLIPPIVYFAFCIVNMQSGPDLIPFIPFFGMFAAWFLIQLGRYVSSEAQKTKPAKPIRWDLLVPSSAMVLVLLVSLGRGAAYRIPAGYTLQDQDARFSTLGDMLGPDDRLYVHGYAELLVVLNRPNLNPYTFLNQGIDRFAAARSGGEFRVILDEMESQRPKLVVLSRLRDVTSREMLEQWVGEHYDKLESLGSADVYIRKGA